MPLFRGVFRKDRKKIMQGAIVVLSALCMVLFFLLPTQTVLVVKTVKPDRIVLCIRMTEGEEFIISYLHSVNKRPVYDTLRVEKDSLRIVLSRFDAFGAGMPDTSTPDNPLRTGKDGLLEYTVNRSVPEVAIFVGRVANHELHVKGRKIPLTSLTVPGGTLCFSAEDRSLYGTLKGRCLWR